MNFEEYLKELELDIQKAYEETPTLEEAEKLAAKFLGAQMRIANELYTADLNARMRKAGVKAIRAAIYGDLCSKSERKPSDTLLEYSIDRESIVQKELEEFNTAEAGADRLKHMLNVSKDAHIFFRNLGKNS